MQDRLVGILSVVVALLAAVLCAAGIATAVDGDYELSTVIGYVAVGVSVMGVILGLAAIFTGRGRVWGVLGVAVSLLANPLVLHWGLGYLGGLGLGA